MEKRGFRKQKADKRLERQKERSGRNSLKKMKKNYLCSECPTQSSFAYETERIG
ncbi:MAG TPA: hypothetical protein H9995_00900 [Candidatus Alistipes excrementigallinarum]|nr:hypothetical protein [Candidatus Alistipes excrementigallinarum]